MNAVFPGQKIRSSNDECGYWIGFFSLVTVESNVICLAGRKVRQI